MDTSNSNEILTCPGCKSKIEENFKFCSVCGYKIPDEKTSEAINENSLKCMKCGQRIEKKNRFCMNCGTSLNNDFSGNIASMKHMNQNIDTHKSVQDPKENVRFIGKMPDNGAIYEMYEADSAENAKAFLISTIVSEKLYNITVDAGNKGFWCKDINGLYLAKLLPYQSDLTHCECNVSIAKFTEWTFQGITMVSNNISDNIILQITCGKCNHEWYDGVAINNDTAVKCPKCGTINRHPKPNINIIKDI